MFVCKHESIANFCLFVTLGWQYKLYGIKRIKLDYHSPIYTIFVLDTINAVMNLKQFSPI